MKNSRGNVERRRTADVGTMSTEEHKSYCARLYIRALRAELRRLDRKIQLLKRELRETKTESTAAHHRRRPKLAVV